MKEARLAAGLSQKQLGIAAELAEVLLHFHRVSGNTKKQVMKLLQGEI